jgi:hypothetical protein
LEGETQGQYFGLRKAAVVYLAAGAAFTLLVTICTSPLMPSGGGFAWIFLGYIATGVVLSRMVHRRLISWHPVHATISNQFSAKMGAVFFWPIVYPVLLFRLSIIRVL